MARNLFVYLLTRLKIAVDENFRVFPLSTSHGDVRRKRLPVFFLPVFMPSPLLEIFFILILSNMQLEQADVALLHDFCFLTAQRTHMSPP